MQVFLKFFLSARIAPISIRAAQAHRRQTILTAATVFRTLPYLIPAVLYGNISSIKPN